jgi:hypothetical protein
MTTLEIETGEDLVSLIAECLEEKESFHLAADVDKSKTTDLSITVV